MPEWKNDPVLGPLAARDDIVGHLVRAFPGRDAASSDTSWLLAWVEEQAQARFNGATPGEVEVVASDPDGTDLSFLARPPIDKRVRLISCLPRYFRGYRATERPIDLDADLLVVEGPNSTGKTGLSEAIEWALTGGLSRRDVGGYGHPRELEGCIANEFCPVGESTLVELVLRVDDQEHRLLRTLVEDYSTTMKSHAVSEVTWDDTILDAAGERALFDSLFAGVHPLLMQHTLRQFIHDTPENRRLYFERLLQIDELSALIEKAVAGDATLKQIPGPAAPGALERWLELKDTVTNALSAGIMDAAAKKPTEELGAALREALRQVAVGEFSDVELDTSFARLLTLVDAAQAGAREGELPILKELRPVGAVPGDESAVQAALPSIDELRASVNDLVSTRRAAAVVKEADRAVRTAFTHLVENGLIDANATETQVCPVCAADDPATLTVDRIREIHGWGPVVAALEAAEQAWENSWDVRTQSLNELRQVLQEALPKPVELDEEGRAQVRDELRSPLEAALKKLGSTKRLRAEKVLDDLINVDGSGGADIDAEAASYDELAEILPDVAAEAAAFKDAVNVLEDAVATQAKQGQGYLLRDRWLLTAREVQSLADEIRWTRARKAAQSTLASIRDGLIELRARLIEDARSRFSTEMIGVWGALREDVASAFDRLHIPQARGRGYKLEFEVRASLDGGGQTHDVSALKIFSESQINVVGIAAYVTRGRLLGHTVLVFDDPVQSMDEDHHNSFATEFLSSLLDQGFQVVVLTHSESFARDIAAGHFSRDAYATLRTRMSVKDGCLVEEGSRRVSERLAAAKRLTKEGFHDDAWRFIRFAVERLYTVVKMQSDSSFDHRTWKDQPAVYMWQNGVSDVVLAVDPDAGPRLRKILEFAAAGAHDKRSRGATDLQSSVKFLNELLDKLHLGAG